MAIKITTGEYTQIVASNRLAWAELKTATEFKADASAKTEEVRAFNDNGEPLVISTDMGQTTGNLSVIRSSSVPFECLAMGSAAAVLTHTKAWNLSPGDTQVVTSAFTKFTLKDAITHPLFLGANFKDKITGLTYGSQWITLAFLNSDGTNEAVAGTLASTYSYTATMKYSFPYAIAVGTGAQYATDSANRILWDGTRSILPAGTDADGAATYFSFDNTGAYKATPSLSSDLVAWLTSAGTVTLITV